MSVMKRFAIALTLALVVLLWVVWSASSPGQGEVGLAAVSAGITEAIVETILAVLVVALCWSGWTLSRRYWRKSRD